MKNLLPQYTGPHAGHHTGCPPNPLAPSHNRTFRHSNLIRHSSFVIRHSPRFLRAHDRGTVALTFIFSLPILLLIISIITQYALIINARIMLNHALSAAARSAMVALPTDPQVDTLDLPNDVANPTPLDGTAVVQQAACMQLVALSPKAKSAPSGTAVNLAQALQQVGLTIPNAYAERYTFADAATYVSWQRLDNNGTPILENQWQPADFAKAPGQRIQLTVKYYFLLTAPGTNLFMGENDTIAGITGKFLPISATYTVQLAHGREATTDSNGYPLNP